MSVKLAFSVLLNFYLLNNTCPHANKEKKTVNFSCLYRCTSVLTSAGKWRKSIGQHGKQHWMG